MVSSNNSMADDLGVMTNNGRAVVDLLMGLCALGGEGLLTLFNIGCVNNSLAHWSWNLFSGSAVGPFGTSSQHVVGTGVLRSILGFHILAQRQLQPQRLS